MLQDVRYDSVRLPRSRLYYVGGDLLIQLNWEDGRPRDPDRNLIDSGQFDVAGVGDLALENALKPIPLLLLLVLAVSKVEGKWYREGS